MPQAELICFEPACRSRYAITDVLYNCPKCGGLLEVTYDTASLDPDKLKRIWRERRCDNSRYRTERRLAISRTIHFLDDTQHVVTLREGNTPLLPGSARCRSTADSTGSSSSIKDSIRPARSKTTA